MNTSIDKIPSPQTRRFERGNKQLLLALASVSMLGFAGSVSATSLAITPPNSVLTTDTQAIFKVSITGGSTFNVATVGCYNYIAAASTAIATSLSAASSGTIVNAGGIAFSGSAIYYNIPSGTSVTANFPITLTLSGHQQGDVISCNVVSASAALAVLDTYSTTASLTVGVGGAGTVSPKITCV